MVQDQLNLVLVKRLSEGHPKTNEIRVTVFPPDNNGDLNTEQYLEKQAIFLVGGFGASEYLKQCLETSHLKI